MTSRPSTAAPILAMLAIVLVMLGAYVGGYFWFGELEQNPFDDGYFRNFHHRWEAIIFAPAAWVDGAIRGVPIRPWARQA
jgi:hypothetical protein